ncbi:DGAT1/2-independent enzyme synthesizing storage lipids [Hetaerina americana]|uniref:DGAT1/2-independent enzyme synthesizing storage lipids n=1 Tax=Hetaerina americana TaxID=62018 RepID=UPI003A7F35D7
MEVEGQLINVTHYIEYSFGDYIDINYTLWLTWLLAPLFITFLLPLLIVFLFYVSALILYIYKLHRYRLIDAYERDFWDGARHTVAAIWDAHGWIWHSYEIIGIENIPDEGSALIIYYHGAIPIDLYYFVARVILFKNRLIHSVADRFLFKIPGWAIILEAFKVIPGTVSTCSSVLKDNNLLAIAPGGVYEAQFGNSYYKLMWKKRLGFAKVALDAKCCIIPIFTQNLREAFCSVSWGYTFWQWLYNVTRFPFIPVYGGFPVKLRTFVGEPIPYEENITPEELKKKVALAIESLIRDHQKVPGSIMRAFLERFK